MYDISFTIQSDILNICRFTIFAHTIFQIKTAFVHLCAYLDDNAHTIFAFSSSRRERESETETER